MVRRLSSRVRLAFFAGSAEKHQAVDAGFDLTLDLTDERGFVERAVTLKRRDQRGERPSKHDQ